MTKAELLTKVRQLDDLPREERLPLGALLIGECIADQEFWEGFVAWRAAKMNREREEAGES